MEKEKELERIREQLETRSEEVQEIMGFIPHWIVRWGITVILFTVLVLLLGSYFFKYPDILSSTVVVTTEHPPSPVLAKSTGKIEHILVKEGEAVKYGQTLGVIANPGSYDAYLNLKTVVSRFSVSEQKSLNGEGSDIRDLGELQTPYENFQKICKEYKNFIENSFHQKEIDSLSIQLTQTINLKAQKKEQLKIEKAEVALANDKYKRAKGMIREGIISKEALDDAKALYLQRQLNYKRSETDGTNLQIRIEELKRNILSIRMKLRSDGKQFIVNLENSFKLLTAAIASWEEKYLLIAPIEGMVAFTEIWSANQNVKAGDTVLTVLPAHEGKLIGRVKLPLQGAGKVKSGQKVNLKFDSFPFTQFGMVIAKVSSKSLIPSGDVYILEITFPNGLTTNFGEKLRFSQGMRGTAEIITEDISLLERFYKNFLGKVNN